MHQLLEKHRTKIASASVETIRQDPSLGENLTLTVAGTIKVVYAPFDYINRSAKVVLLGITPGKQQAINALIEARQRILAGAKIDTVAKAAKETASFSGQMRPNLILMLDSIGVARWLNIRSCESMFHADSNLVHFTSALRYPVYVDGENYSGQPEMTKHPALQEFLNRYLMEEVSALPDAVWIPLGPKPASALNWLASKGKIESAKILDGLPHPSGANAERIAYFLGRKPIRLLSAKTNAATLDDAKSLLLRKVSALPSPSSSSPD